MIPGERPAAAGVRPYTDRARADEHYDEVDLDDGDRAEGDPGIGVVRPASTERRKDIPPG
ncbi:hypothetical protein BRC97_03970 [Halobacteriales archaeon QS_6_71_20]|nr:MAG: hypothetical protein BRC97_03970 [Halobacteriales archaeon QS_6_71_20]